MSTAAKGIELPDNLRKVIESIRPVEQEMRPAAQHKVDNKTKPLGSLGKLEDLGVQLCLIQNTLNPAIHKKFMLVFAADHGVVEEGVSAYPAEVTAQMVLNFLRGGAAINVLCRHHGIDIRVVDMGVNGDFEDHPLLLKKKVRRGTRNFALEPAMTQAEAIAALEHGADAFLSVHETEAIDVVGMGDMGIGNTTAATAVICAVTGITPAQATGRGTGVDDKVLQHKMKVIEKALSFHKPEPKDGLDVLQKVGGLEIGGIAGAALAAASQGVAVVLDGVISTAGGLIAYLINPDIRGYLVCGHRSVEPAQKAATDFMKTDPVIDLNMRLGEGTGAAIAINLLEAAAKIMTEMASFDDAGVSRSEGS